MILQRTERSMVREMCGDRRRAEDLMLILSKPIDPIDGILMCRGGWLVTSREGNLRLKLNGRMGSHKGHV